MESARRWLRDQRRPGGSQRCIAAFAMAAALSQPSLRERTGGTSCPGCSGCEGTRAAAAPWNPPPGVAAAGSGATGSANSSAGGGSCCTSCASCIGWPYTASLNEDSSSAPACRHGREAGSCSRNSPQAQRQRQQHLNRPAFPRLEPVCHCSHRPRACEWYASICCARSACFASCSACVASPSSPSPPPRRELVRARCARAAACCCRRASSPRRRSCTRHQSRVFVRSKNRVNLCQPRSHALLPIRPITQPASAPVSARANRTNERFASPLLGLFPPPRG